jgi:hypothetical protein
MNDQQWQVANTIAQSLSRQNTDTNEFKKAIAYLRSLVNQKHPNAGRHFLHYLQVLAEQGEIIARSNQTPEYYHQIYQVCQEHLEVFQSDATTMIEVLGWASRLKVYRDAEHQKKHHQPREQTISHPKQSSQSSNSPGSTRAWERPS